MEILAALHGIVRWLILVAGVGGLALAASPAWERRRLEVWSAAFVGLLDLQFLLGAVLWIVFRDARKGMGVHAILMLVAIALAHVLRVRLRKAPEGGRRRLLVLGFLLPLVIIVPVSTLLV